MEFIDVVLFSLTRIVLGLLFPRRAKTDVG